MEQSAWSNRSLVLFLHVPKAGGSSVVSFLKERSIFWHYGIATCWMAMHAAAFASGPRRSSQQKERCTNDNSLRMQKALELEPHRAFSVEFHVDSDKWFWVASAARAKLSAIYSRVVTAALVREPRGALLSRYRMWPPYTWQRPHPRVALPLETYLLGGPFPRSDPSRNFTVFARAAAGFQLNSLVPESAQLAPPGALSGVCDADRGAARLSSIDLACETSMLGDFLRNLAAAARLRSLDAHGYAPHVRPTRSGSVDHGLVDAYIADAPRNLSVQRALALAAECDERWFNRTDWSRCKPTSSHISDDTRGRESRTNP